MKRLVKTYLRPYFGSLGLALLLMAIAAASTAGLAQLMQPVLDDVLGAGRTDMILPVAGAVMLTFVLRGTATYLHTIMMVKIMQSIVADIQKHLFSHFMILDLSFFHANPSGQLISRVTSDVEVMRVAVSDSAAGAGKSFLTLVGLVCVMFYQDWKLSLAAFVVFPFASAFVAYIGRRLRQTSKSLQGEKAFLSGRLAQIFQGIRQVQAYGMEAYENQRAFDAINRVRKLNIKAVRIAMMSTPVNEIMVGLVFAGIITYGGYGVASGTMTTGQLGAFLAAFTLAYEPMKKLAKLNNAVQTGLGAAERVFGMLDLQPSIKDKPSATALQIKNPEITFSDVEFCYEGGDLKALKGISFTAEAEKVTALVGPSGGGKTTVMNMIPRFYDAKSGAIKINGQDVREVTLASLRNHIALVSQDVTIFDDTIAANIGYGRAGATEEEIRKAARLAAADEFITGFPDGYQTQVGENGVKLSGGQRQRLAIARAILRDAPILLLDEATSALDNESEKLVQEALAELEKGRTTIVIAHRLSTVRAADKIVVVDQGRVAEEGTHESLMAQSGLYAQMVKTGLRE